MRHKLPYRHWDRGDYALLKRYAATHTAAAIARMLGRTRMAVHQRASLLHIRMLKAGVRSGTWKHSDATARDAVRRYFAGSESQQKIADALGIPRGTLGAWINGTGRPYLRKEFVAGK